VLWVNFNTYKTVIVMKSNQIKSNQIKS